MPRAIGYLRLSPGERAAGGLGIAAQRRSIEEAAKRHGLELASVHVDGKKSGGKSLEQRPGLVEALDALVDGDVLLVSSIDRLTRGSALQTALIEQAVEDRGAKILSALGEGTESDDPEAILMRRIVQAFAEYERLKIGARTKKALGEKRARGERTGTVPYGWRVGRDGKLERDDAEQGALALMQVLRERGRSYRVICARLTKRKIPTRGGGKWLPATVRRILERAVCRER